MYAIYYKLILYTEDHIYSVQFTINMVNCTLYNVQSVIMQFTVIKSCKSYVNAPAQLTTTAVVRQALIALSDDTIAAETTMN